MPNTESSWVFRWQGFVRNCKARSMKQLSRVVSILFHPLIMPSLGLLLLLNSGTYISLLEPATKRAILFVMVLGTLVFPVLMIPVLYYRNLVYNKGDQEREERLVPQLVVLILYIVTFVYFIRLPLSRLIHAYMLSVTATLIVTLMINVKFRLSQHMAALGGLTGLIIALIYLYETPLLIILVLTILAAGITGSGMLAARKHRSWEVYTGFLVGFTVVLVTLLVY